MVAAPAESSSAVTLPAGAAPDSALSPDFNAEVARALASGSRLMAQRLAQYLLLFASGIVVARQLGPVGRAHYALPLTLATTVWVALNLSLDGSTGAMLARREASLGQLTRFLTGAVLVLGVGGFVLTVAVGDEIARPLLAGASPTAVTVAALIVPLTLVIQMSAGLLTRLGELSVYGRASAAGAALQLALLVGLAATVGLTPEGAIAGAAVALVGTAVPLAVGVRRRVGRGALLPELRSQVARRALVGGLALHPATVGLFLNLRADIFIVALLASAQATGLYSLAVTLAETVFLAAWTVAAAGNHAQTAEPIDVASRYTLSFIRQSWMVTAAVASLACGFAIPLIGFVYGRQWLGSVLPLMILTLAAVALSVEAPARLLLARLGRSRAISTASTVGFLLNIAANFGLVPVLGITGAAIASLVSYTAYAAMLMVVLSRETGLDVREVFAAPRREDILPRLARRLMAGLLRRQTAVGSNPPW
jgi:O-antigen/teichoic acid export membrane protein